MGLLTVSDGKDAGKGAVAGSMGNQQRIEPEPRMDKVARVLAALERGEYDVSAEELADRLLVRPFGRGRMHGRWTS